MADPIVEFADVDECVAWFEGNHESHGAFLCKLGKGKHATVTYADVLDVALRYGWIDGQKRGLDDAYWLQRFSRRGARSGWSQINRDKAEALIAAGLMHEAGRRAVDTAKADGRWDAAYASPSNSTVPDDLAEALAADPVAKKFFEALSGANRYAILYRIQTAKKPETRAARIEKFVGMCHRGETIY
ncbi:MAG TPA: YdeI/OmpD-associated family protein [Micromonosporaceae bacterium]